MVLSFLKAANVSKKGLLITINGRLKIAVGLVQDVFLLLFSRCEMNLYYKEEDILELVYKKGCQDFL